MLEEISRKQLVRCCSKITPESLPAEDALSELTFKDLPSYMSKLANGFISARNKIEKEIKNAPNHSNDEIPGSPSVLTALQTQKENLLQNVTYMLAILLKFSRANKPSEEEINAAMAVFENKHGKENVDKFTMGLYLRGERIIFEWKTSVYAAQAPDQAKALQNLTLDIWTNAEQLCRKNDLTALYALRLAEHKFTPDPKPRLDLTKSRAPLQPVKSHRKEMSSPIPPQRLQFRITKTKPAKPHGNEIARSCSPIVTCKIM